MPSEDEKRFFRQAFGLLDEFNNTNWLQVYCDLESSSFDGRIDWGRIPGLLRGSWGLGYIKALYRVVYLLNDTKKRSCRDIYHLARVTRRLDALAAAAKQIYLNRLDVYNYYEDLQIYGDGELGDHNPGHRFACDAWKEAWESLEGGWTDSFDEEVTQSADEIIIISPVDEVIHEEECCVINMPPVEGVMKNNDVIVEVQQTEQLKPRCDRVRGVLLGLGVACIMAVLFYVLYHASF